MTGTNLVLNLTAQGGAQVTATLNQTAGAADRAGASFGSMGNLGQAATYALGQAIYGVTSKLLQMTASVATNALSTAASIETNTMAITAMTGSVTDAHRIMTEVMNEAKSSPFDTTALMDWSKKMIGAGMSSDHVVTSIHTIGDAMAAFGLDTNKASDFMLAWTQMMSRGKIDLGNLNQMSNTGVSALQIFAKATGKSTGELSEMITKGQLLSKDVLPQVETYMRSHYMGDQAKMASTLTGEWDNLHDAINIGMAGAIKPAIPILKEGMGTAMKDVGVAVAWMSTTGVPMLMEFGKATIDWVANAWQTALPAIQDTADFLMNVVFPAIEASLGFIGQHQAVFQSLVVGILGAAAALKVASIAMGIFNLITDANPISLIILAIGGLVAGIMYLWTTSQGFRQFMETMWNGLVSMIGSAIKGILGYIKGLIDSIGSIASHVPGMGWMAGMVSSADSAIDSVNAKLDSIQRNISVTVEVTTVQVTDSHGNSIAENADSANQREDRGASSSTFSKMLGLKGKNNEAKIFNFLKGQGFSSGAASGVIGNLIAESGLDPGIWQRGGGPGRGLAQWSAGARWDDLQRWTRARGMSATTLDGQLAFMMHELQGGGYGSLSSLKGMSATDAAAYFMRHYEMPASHDPSDRQRNALRVLARHGGGTAGTINGNGYGGLSGAASKPFDTGSIATDIGPHGPLFKALLAGASQLRDAFNNLSDDVAKAHNGLAARIVSSYAKTLESLAKTHDGVLAKLKDAQTQAKKLRDESLSLFNQTRDNILKSGDVTTGQGKDFGSMVFMLQNAVLWARQFAGVVAELRGRGLNTTTLEQIIASGPQNGMGYATSILAQGKVGVGQLNALQAQLGSAGASVGHTAADAMYAAAIHSADGFVKGLESQKSRIEKLMTSLAKSMATALRGALGIHSPSTVFAEIGHFTAEGLIQGMDARRDAVMNTATDLVAAGMGSRSGRATLPSGRPVQPVVVNVTGYVGSEQQLARQITRALSTGRARGVNGAS